MSIPYTAPFVVDGYGLKQEDFDEIIKTEKLKDINQKYSTDIKIIQKKFGSKNRMRIIEFNESSGADAFSKSFFKTLILSNNHIFFNTISSNKDCCVVFLYPGHGKKDKWLRKRILPHEFAHHYAWVSEGFPFLLPKGAPKELFPQFAKCYEIGPREGSVYVDNLFFGSNPVSVMKDLAERIADFVCEKILKEKGFWKGMLEEYRMDRNVDPLKKFPGMSGRSEYESVVRYMRRLSLHDIAEWKAMLELAYPNDVNVRRMLKCDKKWAIDLNKEYNKAENAFRRIYEISLTVDHNSFKQVRNCIEYIESIMDLLGIELRTEENWQGAKSD